MGIQIYIKKKALERVGVGITYSTATYHGETPADEFSEPMAEVEGLNIMMHDFDDTVYHDANRWGSSRIPLLEFIAIHELTHDEWYEA
jgi:hypothetical protein